ncbi:MAG: DUF4157 domain-containing protein [Myxococcales bacterium]|nr:DUF4157 domain-containing protein [Myxococcales bacterium]
MEDLATTKAPPSPGKLTRVAASDAPVPAGSSAAPRVDRRADPTHGDVDDGALAVAFGFIREAAHGTQLPPQLAQRLATELGVDVDQVRIHTDSSAAQAAAALNARAFTIGSDIYFAEGAFDPHSNVGIQLIAHEMAHVAENLRGTSGATKPVSHPDDQHERRADEFARGFDPHRSIRVDADDPAELVERVRREGQRKQLPFVNELEEHFGTSFDFVEAYSGEAAELACRLMGATAFAVRNVIALADPSPQRETLMHELTHVMQMGGRGAAAQGRFKPGSLVIGAEGTAVEHEAEGHVAAPTLHADTNTIHRATTPDPAKAKERVLKYCQSVTLDGPDKAALHWGVVKGAHCDVRYYQASTSAFKADTYVTAAKGAKADLDEAFDKGWARDVGAGFRLHKAGNSYVISKKDPTVTTDDWQQDVNRVTIEEKNKWAAWVKTCKDLAPGGKKGITFTWPMTDGKLKEDEPPTSPTELDDYRRAMRHAIAEKYASLDGKFGDFYEQVVQKKAFTNKITGSIFEEIVALSGGGLGPVGTTVASAGIPVFDKKDLKAKGIPGDRLDGDGTLKIDFGGGDTIEALVEAKAYKVMPGEPSRPTTGDKDKMGYYKKLIGVTAYVGKTDENPKKFTFNHFVYQIAVPTDAALKDERNKTLNNWAKALADAFNKGNLPPPGGVAKEYSLVPAPDGINYTFKVKFNPELSYEIPLTQKSINLNNPAVKVPGLKVSQIQATVDDSHNFQSGSVTYGVEAGDIKKPQEKKPLTASTTAGGPAQADNKLTGLTSKLKDFLPVDIDAAIVDDGVEATIKLKQGQATPGLAGFTLDAGATEIKATYKGSGTLTLDAQVGIKHKDKDIKGQLKVEYDNGWGFEGKVTIGEGVIPGVAEISAGVSKTPGGEWRIFADVFTIEKQFGAIKLTGTGSGLEYNIKTGMFKGDLELKADLGMFGSASGTAKIENNKLTKGSLSYDSPELKYPKDKPVITGTVGGTVKFDNGKFSGDIKGSANLNIPALQKIAKEGVGLDVDAHIDADGGYYGSIKSTKPITIGKHLKIPSVGLTLEKDGSLKGDFEIEIVNIKGLKTAKAKGTVDKSGVHIESAEATVEFGDKDKGKFWGSITAKYTDEKGFDVEGTANYKIKDDIIATGTIKYSQETNAIGVELKVSEITLFDKSIHKDLFSASKQIPVVNIYGLGIYIDIGFDLGFDFGFKLTMTPSAKVEDFSLDTMEYKRISAKLEVGGDIYAQLTGTPKLGIGVFAIDPSIIRGGGGLKVPIVGRLDVKPKATFDVGYSPDGGADASAKLGISGEFGIKGSVKPYAEFALLNNLWNPKWEGEPLAEFEILKPTELFNFTVDLNSKEKQEDPALPGKNETKAPKEPEGDQKAKAAPKDPVERGGGAAKTDAKEGPVAEGGDQGPFSLDALMEKLKAIPGFATAKKIFEYAQKIWKVVKPIWDLVEPLMDIIIKRIEEVIGLFDPPPSLDNIGDFLWKLAKLLFNLSFGGLTEIASAIKSLLGKAAAFAKKLINKAVQDGHIGVKRHSYYIWMPWPKDDIEFMAAAEWKINIPGVADLGQHGPPGFLLRPSGVVSLVLYEALQAVGIGYTYVGNSDINKPYNDIWTGAGARG